MIFKRDNLSFRLINVFELQQQNVKCINKSRNFHAISFRLHANAWLKTKTQIVHAQDNCVSYLPANVDYERVAYTDELIAVHFDLNDYRASDIQYFNPKNPEKLKNLFLQIAEEWKKRELGYIHKCSALLHEIFAECYIQTYNPTQKNSKIQNSVTYMEKHFKNPELSIGEIAQQSFMSEVYFRQIFRSEFGISPQKYLVGLRIQHAANLISTGYYSLQEVAYLSGYNDYKYFSVEFKKINGISPSKYAHSF